MAVKKSKVEGHGLVTLDIKNRANLRRDLWEALSCGSDIEIGQELSIVVGPAGDSFLAGTREQINRWLKAGQFDEKYHSFVNQYAAICPVSKGSSSGTARLTLTELFSYRLMKEGDLIKFQLELGKEDPLLLIFPVRKVREEINFVLRDRVKKKIENNSPIQW